MPPPSPIHDSVTLHVVSCPTKPTALAKWGSQPRNCSFVARFKGQICIGCRCRSSVVCPVVKVKVWTLVIALLTWVRLVTCGTLQSWKWQLIGMSQWCHSALCGHPLPALTDCWTHDAASRNTITTISHTRPSPQPYCGHILKLWKAVMKLAPLILLPHSDRPQINPCGDILVSNKNMFK